MTGQAPATAGDATQPIYRGRAGTTRSESVQVWMPNGAFRTLHVYVSLDAYADPALAKAARAGVLHEVTDEVSLAVPYIYHDSEKRLFVLVIPESLRHRALALRAETMAQIAADPSSDVPPYVADCECAVGAEGLRARIDTGTVVGGAPSGAQDSFMDARDEVLRERERQLGEWQANLERREREMPVRTPPPLAPDEASYVDDAELEVIAQAQPQPAEVVEISGAEVVDDVDDYVVAATDDYVVAATDDYVVAATDDYDDAVVDVTAAELVEDDGLHGGIPAVRITYLSVAPDAASNDVPEPPDGFELDGSPGLSVRADSNGVWLFARGLDDDPRSEVELLVQLDPEASVPVVLLTLVCSVKAEQPRILRCPLRYFEPAGRDVLQKLASQFVVELVNVSAGGVSNHEATLAAPRESNVRAVLEALESAQVEPGAYAQAEADCLAEPPDWHDSGHPFVTWGSDEAVLSFTEAAVELDELSSWLSADKQRRLTLLLSLPEARIREHYSRAIRDALGFGLALPEPLVAHAIEQGIAVDEEAVFRLRLDGLVRTSGRAEAEEIETSVLKAMWTRALDEASRRAVSLEPNVLETARHFVGEGADSKGHLSGLATSHDAALAPLVQALESEPPKLAAAEELIARGGHAELLKVCEASARFPAEDAARLFVALAGRGEPARDALIAELERSALPRSRFGAALSLASQHAGEAIDTLVVSVRDADDGLWPGFALALGRYGGGSFRAILRAMGDAELGGERAAHVLAQLSMHGARSQVRRLRRGQDAAAASAAEQAEELTKQFKLQPADAQGLVAGGDLAVFSGFFHAQPRRALG